MGTIGTLNNNSVLTPDLIAKEALRLLKNNLRAAKLVNRNVDQDVSGKNVGDSITIKKPFRATVGTGATINKIGMIDKSVTITFNTQYNVGLGALSATRSLSLADYKSRYLDSAVAQLANLSLIHI